MKKKKNDIGLKYDSGKLLWQLLPLDAIEEIVKVLTMGEAKYGSNNWQKLDDFENRYFGAMMRHMKSHRCGDKFDKESKLLHLSHAACNIIFLLWHELNVKKSYNNKGVKHAGLSK